MKALIIGAGICGPVTAMALRQAGLETTVYEAHAPRTVDVGSYLTVATNGLRALAVLNADQPVRDASFPTARTVLFSGSGKRLGTVPIGSTSDDRFVSRTIKRADLHRALRDDAVDRGVIIQYGKRLVDAHTSPDGVIAHFDDGSHASGDLLVGCDGVHSITRYLIDPAAARPRYVGLLNFGGYTPDARIAPPGVWHMIFGAHAFFGYATDGNAGTVWFANVPRHAASPGERVSTAIEQWRHSLLQLFAHDRGPAVELIEAGTLDLVADNTHDLPTLPVWHRDRMIVIGDAAHAPSPSSGQGASMAIEDAVVLGYCLRHAHDVEAALTLFEQLRRPRVERIVAYGARTSSRKTAGPLGRMIRDLALPVVLRFFADEASQAWMYEYRAGAAPGR